MPAILKNDFIIVSIGCQYFRGLCKELSSYDLNGKTFLLAMKGLEEPSGKRMLEIMRPAGGAFREERARPYAGDERHAHSPFAGPCTLRRSGAFPH